MIYFWQWTCWLLLLVYMVCFCSSACASGCEWRSSYLGLAGGARARCELACCLTALYPSWVRWEGSMRLVRHSYHLVHSSCSALQYPQGLLSTRHNATHTTTTVLSHLRIMPFISLLPTKSLISSQPSSLQPQAEIPSHPIRASKPP